MAYGVSGWFDVATEARVRSVWGALHAEGLCSVLHEGPYRPHVTFGVYEEMDIEALRSELGAFAGGVAPLECKLAYAGLFNNEPPVLFLAMTLSPAVLNLHFEIHGRMAKHGAGAKPYYLPGRWNPHCTLSPAIDKGTLPKAWALVQKAELPIVGRIDRLGLVDTPAEVELGALPLGG